MKNIFVYIVFFVMLCSQAIAEDVSFEATVDANQLTMGNSVHLMLTVKGTQKVDPIALPQLDGFDARYVGPQTQVSVVNGKYSSAKTFIYALFPNKVGHFKIPSISTTIDGKEYHSDPIEMDISDADANTTPTATSLQDKIMLVMGTPKKEVYLHEQVPLTVKLLFSDVTINDIQFPSLDLTGFTKEDFAQPAQSQEVINGKNFNIVSFKTFISPTRTGVLILGPAKLQANLLYRSEGQGARSLFDNDVFGNFFTTYDKRVLTANSQSFFLNVLPLPEEGKPQDFSGAVGKFDFSAAISPSRVNVGDPITLRMKITGDGNLKAVSAPALNDPKFKTYDPQIKDEGGIKTVEQVIIPTATDLKEIPAFKFSYFDTEQKQYKTVTQGPFPIVVNAPKPGEEFKAVGFESSTPTVKTNEEVGRDIVFIKEHFGIMRPQGYHIYQTIGFWLSIVLYWIVWTVFLVIYILRRRLKTDARFARKFKAPRQARQGMQQAEAFMNEGNTKEFYTAVVKTLKDYLGNQLHIPSGGMTFATVQQVLISKNVDRDVIQSIKTIFEAADMVRFASAQLDEGNMRKTFESIKSIIDHLERRL